MKKNAEEKYVWPWVGVVANVPTEVNEITGCREGRSGSTLRDELTEKGFNPTRVKPIWSHAGHSGFALVEFNKDFQGFENAIKFERSFELERHGKKDWKNNGIHMRGEKLYGWVAREEDYNSWGIVGKKVKEGRDLKSISQIEEGEKSKMKQLVNNLSQSIERNEKRKQVLEHEHDEASLVLEDLELHNLHLHRTYKEEIEKMDMNVTELYKKIVQEHENSMKELETERKKLDERERKIEQRATHKNKDVMGKSKLDIEMNEKAMWEQNEANEEAMKLANKHQKEKQKLYEKINEMEAKLFETQALELEIEKLKGNTNVMKHMVGISDGDEELLEKIAKSQIELAASETTLQENMKTLTLKERMTNDEYQAARKEMIKFWNMNQDLVNGENIRVKRLGQLHPKTFLPAMMRKHGGSISRAENEAAVLLSLWETQIGDVQWHPFKTLVFDGTPKRIVVKDDEKLLKLKHDYGERVCDEVVRAKEEIEDHNASGSYVTLELWNYEKNRKATLEEATDVMLKVWSQDFASKKNKRQRL